MADSYLYLDDTGVIVPETADIQDAVQGEYRTAFSREDMSFAPNTAQGVLSTAETLARAEVVNNNAALANQINPNLSGGVFLKAICALTGLEEPAATHSVIPSPGVALAGAPGLTIPAGVRAYTDADDFFELASDVALDASGNGVGTFQSVDTGPIPCDIGALSHIDPDTIVIGWETVLNSVAATLGELVPSDQQLRLLRNETLALQGVGLPEAITSALYNTPNVRSLAFRENYTDGTLTIDGVVLVANSIWVCVAGGTDDDVAATLLNSKSLGCAWNGVTTIDVTDATTGQVYTVTFDRPEEIAVGARATVRIPPASSANELQVKQAILDYAAGLVANQTGFVVGGAVSPFELAGAVMSEIPGVFVTKMEVQLISGGGYQTTELVLTLKQLATITAGHLEVVIV